MYFSYDSTRYLQNYSSAIQGTYHYEENNNDKKFTEELSVPSSLHQTQPFYASECVNSYCYNMEYLDGPTMSNFSPAHYYQDIERDDWTVFNYQCYHRYEIDNESQGNIMTENNDESGNSLPCNHLHQNIYHQRIDSDSFQDNYNYFTYPLQN